VRQLVRVRLTVHRVSEVLSVGRRIHRAAASGGHAALDTPALAWRVLDGRGVIVSVLNTALVLLVLVGLLDGLGCVHRIYKVASVLRILANVLRVLSLLVGRLIVDTDILMNLVRMVGSCRRRNSWVAAVWIL